METTVQEDSSGSGNSSSGSGTESGSTDSEDYESDDSDASEESVRNQQQSSSSSSKKITSETNLQKTPSATKSNSTSAPNTKVKKNPFSLNPPKKIKKQLVEEPSISTTLVNMTLQSSSQSQES